MSNRYLYVEQSKYGSFCLIFLVKVNAGASLMLKTQVLLKLKSKLFDQAKPWPSRTMCDHRLCYIAYAAFWYKKYNGNATDCWNLNNFRILFSITLCRISSKTIKYFQRFLFFAAETRLAQKHFCAKVFILQQFCLNLLLEHQSFS